MVDRFRSISRTDVRMCRQEKGSASRRLKPQRVVQDCTHHRLLREVPYQAMLPWDLVPHHSSTRSFRHSNTGESATKRRVSMIRHQTAQQARGIARSMDTCATTRTMGNNTHETTRNNVRFPFILALYLIYRLIA